MSKWGIDEVTLPTQPIKTPNFTRNQMETIRENKEKVERNEVRKSSSKETPRDIRSLYRENFSRSKVSED